MAHWIRFRQDGVLGFGTLEGDMIALHLWNNFRALGAKLGLSAPEDPLYFLKASSCVTEPAATVRRPASNAGKVVHEGELGIVIGRVCKRLP